MRIGTFFCAIGVATFAVTDASEKQYAIVVDAGSSKTSMLLYQWETTQDNRTDSTFMVDQISKCKAKGRVCKIIYLILLLAGPPYCSQYK